MLDCFPLFLWISAAMKAPRTPRCLLTVMAGLVPAIHAVQVQTMRGGWIYIVTNRPNGTLYTGVTNNLSRRAWEHSEGRIGGFTKRYGLKRLVYHERYEDIRDAIQRERNMKHWPRAWRSTSSST
jgi:putative endonuclease